MTKKKIKLVVTDFDNTLYGWFEGWYTYFSKVLSNISSASGIDTDIIKKDIRIIHQKYGTSEYSHLLDELNIFFDKNKITRDINSYTNILEDAFLERNKILKLYDTVFDSLTYIKKAGTGIAVYTESQPLYSEDRLVRLGLDGLVNNLYAPLTQYSTSKSTSIYDSLQFSQRSTSKQTLIKSLPKEDVKPNPKVLLDIISDFSVNPNEVVYIGDSSMKDICMANNAEITSVLVGFGASSHKEAYNLLRDVSHWTNADIEREKNMSKDQCTPTYRLENNFSEILSLFEFIDIKS